MEKQYVVVFVLGGPGSGKGTQCSLIQKKYNFKHLSAGDLLRQQRKSGSKVAQLIQKYICDGKIVPSQITVQLLKKAMQKSSPINKFLIDGFPRNDQNRTNWQKLMYQKATIPFILQFDCPQNALVKRLLIRAKQCGRSDDNQECIKKRLHTYNNQTLPVVQYYEKMNKCKRVDAFQPVQKVFSILEDNFKKIEQI